MRKINIIPYEPYIMEEAGTRIPEFNSKDYEARISALAQKMKRSGITHCVVYGDREHFANVEYLTGYDPRFEETLLIVSVAGEVSLLVGNEGWAYSYITPLNVHRILYQNFSLQGQPRDKLIPLEDILINFGIGKDSMVGVIGFKYFEERHLKNHAESVDIPSYLVDALAGIVDRKRIINFTQAMTGLEDGLRMTLKTPKEIAYFEYVADKASHRMINILKGLKPGLTELEASRNAQFDAWPISMFPIVNFGGEHVRLGLRSPNAHRLDEGDIITVCYGVRGGLCARSGIAVTGGQALPSNLKSSIEDFYKPFFRAIVEWYESLKIGANCGEIYDRIMSIIGDTDRFGVSLNLGHNISTDEWSNSPFFRGSKINLQNGYYLQSDIIALNNNPFKQAILEDGLILADEELQNGLKLQYPDVYGRIERRRKLVKEVIGINLSADVLPLSNCQAVFHPYLLDLGSIFTIDRAAGNGND